MDSENANLVQCPPWRPAMTHSTLLGGLGFTRLPAGTGRPLLCLIVFLNAFFSNSKRKHYCLASCHRGCSVLTVLRIQNLGSA